MREKERKKGKPGGEGMGIVVFKKAMGPQHIQGN